VSIDLIASLERGLVRVNECPCVLGGGLTAERAKIAEGWRS